MNKKLLELVAEANTSCREFYESDWKYNCAAWTGEELEDLVDAVVNECVMIVLNAAAEEETAGKKTVSKKLLTLAEDVSLVFAIEENASQ